MPARLAGLLRDADGLGKILRKVFVDDGGLGIDESGVEVALEHHQHATNVGRLALILEGQQRLFERRWPTPFLHRQQPF